MTVVDGGAHIGFYTLLAAQLVGPSGRVFSFEPDPWNYQCLLFNINRNEYQNVTLLHKLISNKVGLSLFFQSSGTISSSLGDRKINNSFTTGVSVKKVEIQSTTIDAELKDINIDVVKLDIEGAEPLAIQGMAKTLDGNHPLILFIENNPSALYSLGGSPEVLVEKLRSLAFEIYFIDEANRRLLPLTGGSVLRKGNLYCKRG